MSDDVYFLVLWIRKISRAGFAKTNPELDFQNLDLQNLDLKKQTV